jgi:tRNA (Thr-GGU) A37 N-methylase
LDVLDNMPLLAVKRYIPSFDVFPAPRSGWCDNLKSSFMVADNRFEADNNPAAQRL